MIGVKLCADPKCHCDSRNRQCYCSFLAHNVPKYDLNLRKMVFPYVDSLLNNKAQNNYDIETFSKHHGQTDVKLRELKNIIIKYFAF